LAQVHKQQESTMSKPKPTATLPYSELAFAYEWISGGEQGGNTSCIRRSDGKVFIAGDAVDEDEMEPMPDNAGNVGLYAALPNRRDLGLGTAVARRFADEFAPQLREAVDDAFRKRGAWRAFRNLLESHGLSDAWHAFEESAARTALIDWAREEGFQVPDDSDAAAVSDAADNDADNDADDATAGATGGGAQQAPALRLAAAGLFIYAKDLARLSSFYEAVLGLARVHDAADLVIVRGPRLELLLHALPPAIAAQISIETPPVRREDTALKFFFTVPSLAAAAALAARQGGEVLDDEWRGSGFRMRNAIDPEGNIFQLREPAA